MRLPAPAFHSIIEDTASGDQKRNTSGWLKLAYCAVFFDFIDQLQQYCNIGSLNLEEVAMPINRSFFYSQTRLSLFDGKMSASQKAGLAAILDKWEAEMPQADDRWLAYMLGTAHHETGRTMQAVRETFASSDDQAIARLNKAFNAGKLPWVSQPYWHKDSAGKSWLGRGLVQITHKSNYQKLGQLIGVDLVADPAKAMSLPVAIDIMFVGMIKGSFTGKKLADFFAGTKSDWRNARRIINGLERADLVASYAKQYYGSISYTTS